jgi:hypothetical protein
MPYRNPDKEDSDSHTCWGKAREIQRRTGILLGMEAHSIVSEMCKMWGVSNADEFYQRMDSMTSGQLAADVEAAKARLRKKKGLTMADQIEVSAYA